MHRPAFSGYLLVSGAALLWASAGVASRFAPAGLSSAALADVRLAVGGLVLAMALGPRRVRHSIGWLSRRDVLFASAALALFQWCLFASVARAGATVAAVVSTAGAPLMAEAMASIQCRALPAARWWAALAFAVAGAAWISQGGTDATVVGIALAVAAGGFYAAFTIVSVRAARLARGAQHGGLIGMTIALLFSALAMAPAAAGDAVALLSSRGLALAIYLGLATTAIAYALYAAGLRAITPHTALALQLLQPAATSVMGLLLLGEQFNRVNTVGFTLFAASAGLIISAPSRVRLDRQTCS